MIKSQKPARRQCAYMDDGTIQKGLDKVSQFLRDKSYFKGVRITRTDVLLYLIEHWEKTTQNE
jgi:glutathionyl-hydroquinone reductase